MEPSAAAGAEAGAEPEVSGAVETGAEEPLPPHAARESARHAARRIASTFFIRFSPFHLHFSPHAAGTSCNAACAPPGLPPPQAAGPAHLRKAALHGLSMQQNVKKRKLCCFLQRFDIIIVIVKSQQNHLF